MSRAGGGQSTRRTWPRNSVRMVEAERWARMGSRSSGRAGVSPTKSRPTGTPPTGSMPPATSRAAAPKRRPSSERRGAPAFSPLRRRDAGEPRRRVPTRGSAPAAGRRLVPEKALRHRRLRIGEDRPGLAALRDPPVLQDDDASGDASHDVHLVGDEKDGEAEAPVDVGEEPQDLLGVSGSSAEVASSDRRSAGSAASARAMPTRCFWPPESCAG